MENLIPQNSVFDSLLKDLPKRTLSWSQCIGSALYDPNFGYYCAAKRRVGGEGSDFFTSESLKQNVFGKLVESAAANIFLKHGHDIKSCEFCEIGAEPDSQMIAESVVLRLCDAKKIPQNAVVISNELLDARPFDRFVLDGGRWREEFLNVSRCGADYKVASSLAETTPQKRKILEKYFGGFEIEGFRLDISFDALEFFDSILSQDWRGILIFFDYFRTANQLLNIPSGTARTYFKHNSGDNLLQSLSERDITYSPCSDMFLDLLRERGFTDAKFQTQESFFVKNSQDTIRKIIETPNMLDARKRELVELINPSLLGIDFGAISAVRL